MARAAFSRIVLAAAFAWSATPGCTPKSSRPPQLGPELAPAPTHPAPVSLVLRVTGSSSIQGSAVTLAEFSEEEFEEAAEVHRDEVTRVAVNEDTVADSARVLRFVAAKRGDEPVGVRVFFATSDGDEEDDNYLGLRHADRIEEIDGLPISSLRSFLEAWYGVGKKPEVRLLLSRRGRPHTVIYRRSYPGTALGY